MINSPSTIPLKDEILLAEEQARNRVSILEAEAGRFERLISTQKRELTTLDGTLNDLKNQIDDITLARINLVKEVADLTKTKTTLQEDIKEIALSNTRTRAEIDAQRQEINERLSILEIREANVLDVELAISERVKSIEKEENVLKAKKLTLSEALAQL